MSDRKDIVDEEDAEAQRVRADMAGLPVSYRTGGDGRMVGSERLIQLPTLKDTALFGIKRIRTCGGCKFFQQKAFAPVRAEFMAQLVHDHRWNPAFIGDDPQKMGRCEQDETLLTGPNSLGCSQFRAK